MKISIIYDPRSLDSILAASAFMSSPPPDSSTITLIPWEPGQRVADSDYVVFMATPTTALEVHTSFARNRAVNVYHNRPQWMQMWLGPSYTGADEEYSMTRENIQFYGNHAPLYMRWYRPETCPAFTAALTETKQLRPEFGAWIRSMPLHAEYLPKLWEDLQTMTVAKLSQILVTQGAALLRAEDAAIEYALRHASARLCISPRTGWERPGGRAIAASPLALESTAQTVLALLPDADTGVAYTVHRRQVYGMIATRSPRTLQNLRVLQITPNLGEFSVNVEQFFTQWVV